MPEEVSNDPYVALLTILEQYFDTPPNHCEKLEEQMRYLFGVSVYPMFTLDKLFQLLLKTVRSLFFVLP